MPQIRKGVSFKHMHADTTHTLGANVSLMPGHAVAAGLIGYINTNTSLEREEGKDYFMHLPSCGGETQCFNSKKKLIIF